MVSCLKIIQKNAMLTATQQQLLRKQLGEQLAVYRLGSFFAQQLHTPKQTKGFQFAERAEQICFGGLEPDLVGILPPSPFPVWNLLIMYPDVLSKIGVKDHMRNIVKIGEALL